mmetsp:Transcript_17629/g.61669  ORF Transcript_17629/g.61669 Transcript_17629/m.61669 type:complete len:294 (+) Transcript_17629:635-1516(+)
MPFRILVRMPLKHKPLHGPHALDLRQLFQELHLLPNLRQHGLPQLQLCLLRCKALPLGLNGRVRRPALLLRRGLRPGDGPGGVVFRPALVRCCDLRCGERVPLLCHRRLNFGLGRARRGPGGLARGPAQPWLPSSECIVTEAFVLGGGDVRLLLLEPCERNAFMTSPTFGTGTSTGPKGSWATEVVCGDEVTLLLLEPCEPGAFMSSPTFDTGTSTGPKGSWATEVVCGDEVRFFLLEPCEPEDFMSTKGAGWASEDRSDFVLPEAEGRAFSSPAVSHRLKFRFLKIELLCDR